MTTKKKVLAKNVIRELAGHIGFGEMVAAFRLANDITQVELAQTLNISKQDLCNIEKGRKLVSVERAVAFAESLGVPKKSFAKYALQDQLYKAGLKGSIEIN